MLGGFELGDEVLDVHGADKKIVECRSDEDFMLYDGYEFWVEFVIRHVKLPCWYCLDGCGNESGLKMCHFSEDYVGLEGNNLSVLL